MDIKVARYIGFCPGVKRAINIAEHTLEKSGPPVYTLGPIIHNPQVVSFLERKGIEAIPDSLKTLKTLDLSGKQVVIRSHGVPPRARELLRIRGADIIDATCPIVKKAQRAACSMVEEGYRLILIGSASHPEVRAILGCVDDRAVVLKGQKEMSEWWKSEGRRTRRVGVISQTTVDVLAFSNLVAQLIGRVPDLRVMDTLCHSTIARQHEARRLAQASDFALVLGGRNSSNTASLRRICQASGVPTLQLESPEELDLSSLDGVQHLAILGGASTPEWIVGGVREKIRRAGLLKD